MGFSFQVEIDGEQGTKCYALVNPNDPKMIPDFVKWVCFGGNNGNNREQRPALKTLLNRQVIDFAPN
jgi:hypothetical protein